MQMSVSAVFDSLLCFQHCGKVNILCFVVPNYCPICGKDLSCADLAIPPFRIPSPLSCGTPNKLSLLIKPTYGSFTRDFKIGDMLHIGLSNSEGIIYEFSENGISSNTMEWTNFLSVSLTSLSDRFEQLDEVLESSKTMDIWVSERYHEIENNCFDYVVFILNMSSQNSNFSWTKLQLTQEFISPAIKKINRLMFIVENVSKNGFFLQANILEPIIS